MAAWAGSMVGDQTEPENGLGGREHLGFYCEAKRGNEGLHGKDTKEVRFVEISLAKLWIMEQKAIQILQTTFTNMKAKSTSLKAVSGWMEKKA